MNSTRKPIIYQILPRLWGEGRFSSVDDATLSHIASLGVSHVWYTGVPRHASGESFVKGTPGSPYAVCDWYDVNPYLADDPSMRMAEWEELIARTHHHGLKVVMDLIPNHVARNYGATRVRTDIAYFGDGDDTSIADSPDNDFLYFPGERFTLPGEGEWQEFPARSSGNNSSPSPDINDWYDTIKLNYHDTHTGTWDKMYEILRYWSQKGVDGFRFDMVDLVPVPFLSWLLRRIRDEFPDMLFIAETYRRDLYGSYIDDAGFDLLYDKEGLYNSIRAIYAKNCGPLADAPCEGWESARQITACWQYLQGRQPRMLNFLENHDEQRIASPQFAADAARGMAALYVSALFNHAAFMLYCGQEVGEDASESSDGRTSIFDFVHPEGLAALHGHLHGKEPLDEQRAAVLGRYRDVMTLAASPLCGCGKVYDLCWCNSGSPGFDPDRHFVFLRSDGRRALLVFCNFSAHEATADIRICDHAASMMGVPESVTTVHAAAFGASITDLAR